MSVRCKDPARHSKWGEWADDGQVGWCRICSPGDEPHATPQERPQSTESGDSGHLKVTTGTTDEALLRRVFGKEKR